MFFLVERVTDRLIAIEDHVFGKAMNVATVFSYAGCNETEKEKFWMDIGGTVSTIRSTKVHYREQI